MVNVGIVTTWFASGAGNVAKNYERALENKHQVFIYARGGMRAKHSPEWNQSNVTWAPPHPCLTGIYAGHFGSWIKRHSIDTVLFNEQRYWAPIILARKLGVLVGAYVDYYTADTVPFFGLFDFLVCNTMRHYSVFRNHPQCCFIPWGTQTDAFIPPVSAMERPLTFITSAGWTGRNARLSPWMDRRGTGMVLKSFQRVQGNCRLVVFSQVPLNECPDEWKSAVQHDRRIEFLEGTFEPTPYSLGDVYVYPSRLDGIGLTLPEALSCGLPAIATDSAPMNEFVLNGENGVLIPVKEYHSRPDGYYWPEAICDEEKLLDALNYYAQNPEAARSHGKTARKRAEQYLSWSKNAGLLAEWIAGQKIMSDRPGIRINELRLRAEQFDRRYNPTPLENILKSLLAYWQILNHENSLVKHQGSFRTR